MGSPNPPFHPGGNRNVRITAKSHVTIWRHSKLIQDALSSSWSKVTIVVAEFFCGRAGVPPDQSLDLVVDSILIKNPEIRLAICLSVMAQMGPPNDLRYCESFAKINAHQFITRVRFARDQKILHMCGMRIEINSSRRARNVTDIMNITDTLLVESFRRIAVIYHPSARLIGTSPLTGALYATAGEGGRLGGPETGEPFEEIYNSILKETYKSL